MKLSPFFLPVRKILLKFRVIVSSKLKRKHLLSQKTLRKAYFKVQRISARRNFTLSSYIDSWNWHQNWANVAASLNSFKFRIVGTRLPEMYLGLLFKPGLGRGELLLQGLLLCPELLDDLGMFSGLLREALTLRPQVRYDLVFLREQLGQFLLGHPVFLQDL